MKKQRPRQPVSLRYKRIMSTFAKRLKKAREDAGYESAEQFALAGGWHPHAYRKYERGASEPNFETFTRICELLEVTPNDLLPEAHTKRQKGDQGSKRRADAAA
jgi:transcriptional regulator with XRE-family HTH domain